jgi:hypothetical protein
MATYVDIDTGSANWRIKNADPRSGTAVLNVSNQAAAVGATFYNVYAARISETALEVQADTEELNRISEALGLLSPWPPADWPGVSVQLKALGIPVPEEQTRALASTYASTPALYDVDVAWPEIEANYPWQGVPRTRPAGLVQGQAYVSWFQINPANGGDFYADYFWYDSADKRHYTDTRGFRPYAPMPSDEVTNSWRSDLERQADTLTQVAQTKQAFLQDLVSSLNKFYEWITAILQRSERDKQGFIDRF